MNRIYTVEERSVFLSSAGIYLESSWNVMAHDDAREGKWRGNWRMEWVTSTLHATSEHGVSSITTADVHTSIASSRLDWRPRRFKWIRPFRRKTKSGFCACAITFQTQSTSYKVSHLKGSDRNPDVLRAYASTSAVSLLLWTCGSTNNYQSLLEAHSKG